MPHLFEYPRVNRLKQIVAIEMRKKKNTKHVATSSQDKRMEGVLLANDNAHHKSNANV